MTEQESYISAVKTFNRYLEQHHLRKTPERFFILKKIWQMRHHFSVDALYDAVLSDKMHVSRATVYNTVDLLSQCGVVRRHQFSSSEATTYEAARGNHIHLICNSCGKVTEVPSDTPDMQMMTRHSFPGFSAQYFSIYAYGLCAECSKQMPPATLSPITTPTNQ